MAKSTRGEAWHESYKVIFERVGCIRLTLEQVSVCMGIPARYVRKRYPDGWANMWPILTLRMMWLPICWRSKSRSALLLSRAATKVTLQ